MDENVFGDYITEILLKYDEALSKQFNTCLRRFPTRFKRCE